MKNEILKDIEEINSRRPIIIFFFSGWQFNAEIKRSFQMLQTRKGCWHPFLNQYCRSDSYSRQFSDVQILSTDKR